MNPIAKYLKNLFSKRRIVTDDSQLHGLVKVDAILNGLVNEKKVPGLAITVLKNGKPLFEKGYGYADIENKTTVNPQKTIFRIASVSKPIAATALAYMVHDGLINLDASYYKYVPYFPQKKWDFTIRQLASHTAGIRGYKGIEYGLNKPYTIKDSIEIFKDDELLFEPGTDYFYNSFDWVMISLAMQEASGIPFEEYVQEKVLKPLEMNTTLTPTISQNEAGKVDFIEGKATFYTKNRFGFRKAIPVNNYFKLAGGGYLSTTNDLTKLGQAYLDGKILNQDVLAHFLNSELINKNNTYYGLGWQVSTDVKGRKYYGHIGNGVGGYSNFFIYPDYKIVVAVLTNCTAPNIQSELDAIIDNCLFTAV